jgi:hypothetical protein
MRMTKVTKKKLPPKSRTTGYRRLFRWVPEELHTQIKMIAISRGNVTIDDVVEEMAKEYLERRKFK